jgi:DsbC/DsbD-like thiol-disulfide interchange protein
MLLERRATLLLCLTALVALAAHAERFAQAPRLDATLTSVSARSARPLQVRLNLLVSPGWHIAAEQPGTAGLPTRIAWQAPSGWQLTAVRWPVPRRQVDGRDTLYTYDGRVMIDAEFTAPLTLPRGPIRAVVSYGLCRDVCIPGRVALSLVP